MVRRGASRQPHGSLRSAPRCLCTDLRGSPRCWRLTSLRLFHLPTLVLRCCAEQSRSLPPCICAAMAFVWHVCHVESGGSIASIASSASSTSAAVAVRAGVTSFDPRNSLSQGYRRSRTRSGCCSCGRSSRSSDGCIGSGRPRHHSTASTSRRTRVRRRR